MWKGEWIALLGNLGGLIGFYLYYEFYINGRFVNLMIVKLLGFGLGMVSKDCKNFLECVKNV